MSFCKIVLLIRLGRAKKANTTLSMDWTIQKRRDDLRFEEFHSFIQDFFQV
jgi:hypothetical protein